MNLRKISLIAASIALFNSLIAETFIKENDNNFEVGANSYSMTFDKATGAIKKSVSNGKDLGISSPKQGLWSLELMDNSEFAVERTSLSSAIVSDGKLELKYVSEEVDINILIEPKEEYLDFKATAKPKLVDIRSIAVPAGFIFAPQNLKSANIHVSNPRSIGLKLNSDFFIDRSSHPDKSWIRGQSQGEGAYREIFSGSAKNLHPSLKLSTLKEGKDAKKWLADVTIEKLKKMNVQATRPFGEGQADIVVADTDDGVFYGGSRLGGKGAIFRCGGWWKRENKWIFPYVVLESIYRAKNTLPQDQKNRDKVVLINFPIYDLWVNFNASEWEKVFIEQGNYKNFVQVHNISELVAAMNDPKTLAIINPYGEVCPTPVGVALKDFAKQIKKYVVDGGYWFESEGYNFYIPLVPQKYLSIQQNTPSSIADFVHMNLNSQELAIYCVQPISRKAWAGEKNKEKIFIPSSIGFGGSDDGGYYKRAFLAYVKNGDSFETPIVRFNFGKSDIESAQEFCSHNKIKKTLDKKLPKSISQKFKDSVLVKIEGRNLFETSQIFEQLPTPNIAHLSNYLFGGFDKQYPDHFPPNPRFGTDEDFKMFIKRVKEKGSLFMPYTNNTWWCDEPKGPTFEKYGDACFLITESGKPNFEKYNTAVGWTISMWHKDVRETNERLLKEALDDYQSDIVFQDQTGARSTRLDFNPASPTPNAYAEGMISTARQDAKKALLSTEDGWWGICDWEIQFCGHSFGFIGPKPPFSGFIWDAYPKDAVGISNMVGAMFHDKLSLTHHDLGTSINNMRQMGWSLGVGYSMILRCNINSFKNPEIAAWINYVDRMQKSIVSKYLGEKMIAFEHKWTNNQVGNGDSIVKSAYGDFKIIANMDSKPLAEGNVVIAPDSFLVLSPTATAGAILESDGLKTAQAIPYISEEKDGKIHLWVLSSPNQQAVVILPRNITKITDISGNQIDFEAKANSIKFKLPDSQNKLIEFLLH